MGRTRRTVRKQSGTASKNVRHGASDDKGVQERLPKRCMQTVAKKRAERKAKMLQASAIMPQKPVDPVSILPVEIFEMILRSLPSMRNVVALGRVSKRWQQMIEALCLPSASASCHRWGFDVDWARKAVDRPVNGTSWQRFSAEGMMTASLFEF